MLKGKTAVLAVTGSIAAYKIANLARMLKKLGCNVQVLMTENATNFINPITFETLTSNRCFIDTFDRNFQYSVEHVALAKQADVVMIAPADANVIGKIANGIADDMLTTTVMACPCKKLVAPAMNHNMYHNPIVQDNLKKLAAYGYGIITPDTGMLANGDIGDGRMPDESVLLEHILREIACEKDLAGKRVLVTAGAAAHTDVAPPMFCEVVPVVSAADMFEAVAERAPESDIVIKAAAVSDYTPETTADSKLKKSDADMSIPLKRTQDILKYLGANKRPGQFLCGFSMETDNVLENSRKKLASKNCDMICANSLRTAGAGFGTDTNVITLITEDSDTELPLMSKEEAAHRILDVILEKTK